MRTVMKSSLMGFARDNFGKMSLPYCPLYEAPAYTEQSRPDWELWVGAQWQDQTRVSRGLELNELAGWRGGNI